MSEYLERSALLQSLKSSGVASDFALYKISNFPAADAAPVVHGKWIRIDDPEFICGDFECSNCSHREYEVDTDELMPGENHLLYCPFCGAKMDGRGKK